MMLTEVIAVSLLPFIFSLPVCIAFGVLPPETCCRAPHRLPRYRSCISARRSNSNPFKSLVSNFVAAASSLVGTANSMLPAELEQQISSVIPSTWDDIRSKWEKQATDKEREFRDNLPFGYGDASPLHNLRLYDATLSSQAPRVTFYRDSASWCPYCQKVWMALEHKRIPYSVQRVNMRCYGDKTKEFMKLQPNGQIPVAVIDGMVYGQSNDILAALDVKFPDTPKLSEFSSQDQQQKAKELLRLERSLFGAWMYWLTSSSRDARKEFINCLDQVENVLSTSQTGFFMGGKSMSIVDIQFAPFLERMAASLLFFKGFQIRFPPSSNTANEKYSSLFPHVNKWFDAMEKCEAYQVTKSDYYTHCWDLPPQLGGCTYEPDGEIFERAINGERTLDGMRGSWELPLQPHNGGVEPDWTFISSDEDTAKREAVERLTANHVSVVRFASRGAGRKGMPPVSAALSDPNATPDESVLVSVDAVLRCVAVALLEVDVKAVDEDMKALALHISRVGHQDGVTKSISYLRDRVGVPRDMRLPAARQFRAYLNWALAHILEN